MALVDLDANDPFNPLKCAVTVGRAVLAKPGPKLAATRAVTASASGRLSRGKGLAATASASVAVFIADVRRNRSMGFSGPVAATVSSSVIYRQRRIVSSVSAAVTVAAALRVGDFFLASNQFVRVSGSGSIDRRPKFGSRQSVSVVGQAFLANLVVLRNASSPAVVAARACLDAGRDGLGVCDVIREILLSWGIENPAKAPGWVRTRALHDLNSAMQTVWNQAKDRSYWSRSTITVSLTAGTAEHPLEDGIQNVVGPVRINDSRQPLVTIGTLGELEQFANLFLDGDAVDSPVAYFIARENQSGKEPCKCTLHVTPTPTEPTDFLLDVVLEAPRFSWNDVDRCPRVPIPHRYIESLLLPIVRYQSMSCHLFVDRDRAPQIEGEYLLARQGLELADPLPGKSGDNINRREEART